MICLKNNTLKGVYWCGRDACEMRSEAFHAVHAAKKINFFYQSLGHELFQSVPIRPLQSCAFLAD